MVKATRHRTGQTVLEFMVILGMLSMLGTFLYFKMMAKGGIPTMQENTVTKISND
jgi:hypothetical protein